MKFNIGDVITEAFDRLTTAAGATFVAALTVIGVVQTAAIQDLIRSMLEWFLVFLEDPEVREQIPAEEMEDFEALEQEVSTQIGELTLALGLSPGLATAVLLAMFVISIVVVVVAIDTFAHRRDSLEGIQTSRLGWKVANLFAGWIAFGILVLLGLLFFIIPGVILSIVLVFFAAAIVIDDQSFIAAFGSSFRVVRNNIVGTLVIVLLVLGIFIGLGIVGNVFGLVLPELLVVVVSNVLNGIGQVFAIAVVALAYAEATTDDSESADAVNTEFPTE